MIELIFVVVDKTQKTVPFFLNAVQKDFINKLNQAKEDYKQGKIIEIAMLVLKGRQQGFTTLVTAYQLASTITKRNFQGFTAADEGSNTEAIFQNKAKLPQSYLPERAKPTEKFNNKREMLFSKLNSSWSVDTATKNMGRSRTINFFHGSECAFWKDGIAATQAGLGEAFTADCIKIYESTANGFNDFQIMWDSGTFINCFYEWWRTPEYRVNFETEEKKRIFIENIENKDEWIYNRLRWLKNEIKLELEQLYWYFNKYQKYIDKELIKQEYPCMPEEAFLSSGACYFDKEKLITRISEVRDRKPIKVGYFKYTEISDVDRFERPYITLKDIEWVDDKNGYIKIYEDVQDRVPYVLARRYGAVKVLIILHGQVLNNMTGKQVAVLKRKFNEKEYTKQMYCLGMYYNEALIGIEANFSTYPIEMLDDLKYPNQFVREKEDDYREQKEKKFGFKTTVVTRPLVLGMLQSVVVDEIENIQDLETLNEMLRFIVTEKGRPEAEVGCHDDLVLGLAIAYYIRKQQKYSLLPEKRQQSTQSRFGYKTGKQSTYDYYYSSNYKDTVI